MCELNVTLCVYVYNCIYRDVFPSSRCLFMYRDVVAVAKSLHRLSMALPRLRLASLRGRFSGHITKMIAERTEVKEGQTSAYMYVWTTICPSVS